jgi:predicted small lipoprotein YifL
MRHRILTCVAAAAVLSFAGCGSDDDNTDSAATATTPAGGQATTPATTEGPETTTEGPETTTAAAGDQLSADGRAIFDASQDLAADVTETAEQFADGRIDDEEATARLELARERAGELRKRAEQLPEEDRARARLASLNEEIGTTAAEVSRLGSAGRHTGRKEINKRIDDLRSEARSTFDSVSKELDEPAQKRFREALERIGVG